MIVTAVWHGFSHKSSPLQFLRVSFESQKEYIVSNCVKSGKAALHLSLFRPVASQLPEELIQSWMDIWNPDIDWYDYGIARDKYEDMLKKYMPYILELHKIECGCNWNKDKTYIESLDPNLAQ